MATLGIRPLVAAVALLQTLATQSSTAIAAGAYKCTVKGAYSNSNGSLVSHLASKAYVGKEFVVDQSNGKLLGVFSSSVWARVEVLDKGSKNQSFKAAYSTDGFVSARLLVVREFEADVVKPFTLLDNDDVFSGTCMHF